MSRSSTASKTDETVPMTCVMGGEAGKMPPSSTAYLEFTLNYISMINYRTKAYIFLAATILLLIAAILSPHEESIMDIFFFTLSFISGAVSINMFKKNREQKRFRSY